MSEVVTHCGSQVDKEERASDDRVQSTKIISLEESTLHTSAIFSDHC